MILYDFQCTSRHRFSGSLASMFDDNPRCPECGAATHRIPANPHMGGRADAGPSREDMPRSWRGIDHGNPEAVEYWRRKITHREKLEEKYPELAGDRRPVLAHEGMFSRKPLRAGDDIAASVKEAAASPYVHNHKHSVTGAQGREKSS